MTPRFDHEKLNVYQKSLKFLEWVQTIDSKIPKSISIYSQLDRASTSIPLNIAEGSGKYQKKDRCRFYDIARGSATECAACLDVLIVKGFLTVQEAQYGKLLLSEIVAMLIALIKSHLTDRVYEENAPY